MQHHVIRDGLANTNVMKYKLTVLANVVLLIACSQEQNGVLREYISRGNADADIALTIFDNKTFKMDMEIFNVNSENDVIFYIGKWAIEPEDQMVLSFDPIKNKGKNPKYLFYDGNGVKMPEHHSVEMLDEYTFKFNKNDQCIFIWNIMSCVRQ